MSKPVRVLIVDDSSLVRQALRAELGKQRGIEVVGTAPDPFVARDKIIKLEPDVLTLDLEMPRMDGLTFLRKLMKFHPVPTIIVSAVTPKGCKKAIECLEAGAIEVVPKPDAGCSLSTLSAHLGDLIRGTSCARVTTSSGTSVRRTITGSGRIEDLIIATGSSTGGTEALRALLTALPAEVPGIVMTQHMPQGFTSSFAERLNELCAIEVREAVDGDLVQPGLALLAPGGGSHMSVHRNPAGGYLVRIKPGPRVCRHRPSVEVLFQSVADCAGAHAMGIIMTGMGKDGANGLLSLRNAGGHTVSQDEASCVVYGMPREAVACGASCIVSPLDAIPDHIIEFAEGKVAAAA